MTYSKFLSAQTSSTGTNWVSLTAGGVSAVTPINEVLFINDSGTTIQFRKSFDPTSVMQITDAKFYLIEGVNSTAQIEFRRADTSNTQVTIFVDAMFRKSA
jgi:hypothetical protein